MKMKNSDNNNILIKIDTLLELLSQWKETYLKEQNQLIKNIRITVIKVFSAFCLIIGAIFSSFSLYKNYIESKERDIIIQKYINIAKESFFNSAKIHESMYLLDKAKSLSPEDKELKFIWAYIKVHHVITSWADEGILLSKSELERYYALKAEIADLIYMNPDRSEPYLLDSMLSIISKDYANAKLSLEKAYDISPNDAYTVARFAYFYYKIGDNKEAKRLIYKALKLNNLNKYVYHINALILHRIGDYNNAVDSYLKVLKIDPYYSPAIYNLAFIYVYRVRDLAKAKMLIDEHLRLNKDNKDGLMLMGGLFQIRRSYDEAILVYEKILKNMPNFYPAIKAKAIIFRDKGEYDKSLNEFLNLIKADPVNADVYFLDIAKEVYIPKHDYRTANYFVEKSLKINPNAKRALEIRNKISMQD